MCLHKCIAFIKKQANKWKLNKQALKFVPWKYLFMLLKPQLHSRSNVAFPFKEAVKDKKSKGITIHHGR